MAKVMFADRVDGRYEASGAGTLVIDGQPMSQRTRIALEQFGLADLHHRSRQLTRSDIARADLIVAMEPDHIRWVRKQLPEGAGHTACLKRLVRDLPQASGRTIPERVAELGLASVDVEPWEEVLDPGGGDQDVFHACATELDLLVDNFISVLDAIHGRPRARPGMQTGSGRG